MGGVVDRLRWQKPLEPATYGSHALHALDRDWPETNCYIDVWIELLHALGLPVEPMLAVLLAADFEGDQWTFCKPAPRDLELLYGLEIQELNLWRPLLEHVRAQLGRGRVLLVEVDAFHLPDTEGTDYHQAHVKTTVGMASIDVDRKSLRYFHNRALYALEGADFDGLFRLDRPTPDDYLPPFCEIVKAGSVLRRPDAELRECSLALARHHFARRPAVNPLQAYAADLDEHVRWLVDGGMATYHGYGFSLVRQLGAGAELLASYVRWLGGGPAHEPAYEPAAEAFARLSSDAKALLLKLARIASSGRPRELSTHVAGLSVAWQSAMERLAEHLGA